MKVSYRDEKARRIGEVPVETLVGTHWPRVSIVVPAFRQVDALSKCLGALARQTYPGRRYEVIVVENGSPLDPTAIAHGNLRLRLARECRPGSYAARNRGIALARGDIIGFTDADCVPADTWIESGVQALLEDSGTEVVGGRVTVFPEDPTRLTAVELHQLIRAFPQERFIRSLKFATTANLFTYRRTFERIGGFEADLMSGGDAEWGQRFHAAGGKVLYSELAEVKHPARRTLRQLIRQRRRTMGGRFQRRQGVGHPPHPLDGTDFSYNSPFRRVAQHASHALLSRPRDMLRFGTVELLLFAVAKLELVRLSLGGKPARR
jgi:glycosyltransferase involved in cell wall biosynthesis